MRRTSPAFASTSAPAGLLAAGVPVPLDGVSVDALITADCARVTVAQRYRNREAQPIEAVYVFPLDEGAAVCGFEAVVAGVHYVGTVKPRDEAFREYDEAMLAGHGAYLLDEEHPDVFTASVGNLPAGAEVLIRITYVTELAVEGTGLRFTIPTTVSPRYAPAEDTVGVGRAPSDALNPPVAWTVPYGLDLSVALHMPGAIRQVASPSHAIAVTLDGAHATVGLALTDAALDRDFVLLVEAAGLNATRAIVERDGTGACTAALVLQPAFEVQQAPSEVIFLVDRSGSMEGTSIAEVRRALQLCLRSLVAGSRFDIVGFGSTVTSLFGASRAYDDTTLAEASAHVDTMHANLGGTEILPALQAVLDRPSCELPRQIVLLTDGQVTNTDAVIALVGRHATTTRVFTFGIGAGASAYLVRGVARAGHGAAEFIAPGERLEATVLRQFAKVLAPALTDVRVDWGGVPVTVAPSRPPAVFAGSRVVVYAWLGEARETMATFSANGPWGPITAQVRVDPTMATTGATLGTLAARARIREIEAGAEWLSGTGSQQHHRRAGAAQSEIVRLATTYGLVSRETSCVAVEQRPTPVAEAVQLRRIPVALTSDWGGFDRSAVASAMRQTTPRPAAAMLWSRRPDDIREFGEPTLGSAARDVTAAPMTSFLRRTVEAALGRKKIVPANRPLDAVVALQRADGSWDLTADLAAAMGVPWDHVSRVPAGSAGIVDGARGWATCLAVAWLERHAADHEDEWRLLVGKARQWLDRLGVSAGVWHQMRQAAEATIR